MCHQAMQDKTKQKLVQDKLKTHVTQEEKQNYKCSREFEIEIHECYQWGKLLPAGVKCVVFWFGVTFETQRMCVITLQHTACAQQSSECQTAPGWVTARAHSDRFLEPHACLHSSRSQCPELITLVTSRPLGSVLTQNIPSRLRRDSTGTSGLLLNAFQMLSFHSAKMQPRKTGLIVRCICTFGNTLKVKYPVSSAKSVCSVLSKPGERESLRCFIVTHVSQDLY